MVKLLFYKKHIVSQTQKIFEKRMWMRSLFFTWNSQSCGVMIFFSNKLNIEVTEKIIDSDGWFILLKCIVQGRKILLYNVYTPNNKKYHITYLLSLKEPSNLWTQTSMNTWSVRETGTSHLKKKWYIRGKLQKNGRKAQIFSMK